MNIPKYISHLYNDGNSWHFQSNEDHCLGTAEFAEKFAAEFGMSEWGKMLGLLHDRGKEGEGFQSHIRNSSGFDTHIFSKMPHQHSIQGAKVAHSIKGKDSCFWLSNPIAGHHRGLYDGEELEYELNKTPCGDISLHFPSLSLSVPYLKLCGEDSAHITRMLFSCLIDADRLDTERFMNPERFSLRNMRKDTLPDLLSLLQNYRQRLSSLPQNNLNDIRNHVQHLCIKASKCRPGIFELTVPTGGGKTLASVLWALNHAVCHNKKRIIIAIPFTSIVVQTAAVLKDIFGDENVLEHHSALNDNTEDERSRLAVENWDAPVIVTTNVQLFESIFSNKPSKCRKLHSIANSVVILDEVQTLPLTFLQPIVNAMKAYVKLFGTSFLFSTATQPILNGEYKGNSNAVFSGFTNETTYSIIPASCKLHDKLRRVNLKFCKEKLDYSQVAQMINKHERILCIVNTRKTALEIFKELPNDGNSFHLSRYMCTAHLLKTINEIKHILKNTDRPIRVISTQLIEAGVDIDFPVVFRELAGLDSLLQAAGRCNREGMLPTSTTTVFSLNKETPKGFMGFCADTMKDLIALFPEADWFDPKMINLYYSKLYARCHSFDKEGIVYMLSHPKYNRFEEAAEKFRLIDEDGIKIIVNFEGADKLVRSLKENGPTRMLARELGQYSVSVPIRLFNHLAAGGLIEEPWKGFYYIPLKSQYDEMTGLKNENNYLEQNFII